MASRVNDEQLAAQEYHNDSDLGTLIDERDIARDGNGYDEQISEEQYQLISELHENVKEYRQRLDSNDDNSFCDYEMCRRYLVARQWNLKKAEDQLISTLKWYHDENISEKRSWLVPKALSNPHAIDMRCIGWDSEGRPILYLSHGESLDRFDAVANNDHLVALLEDIHKLLLKRRKAGCNPTARTRQIVAIFNFDGFSTRDLNPKSSIITARMLQHYPETVHCIIALDAPFIFGSLYRIIAPLLDERVRSKIVFLKGTQQQQQILKQRLGSVATQWVLDELKENAKRRPEQKHGNPKKYWIPPTQKGQHDSRGIEEYVMSEFYIKTPGDAYEERKA